MATKKNDPTAAYLESLGVKDVDLSVPDISSIRVSTESPAAWVDKHGNTPPPGLELYRLDTSIGAAKTQETLRRLTRPIAQGGAGYQVMPPEAGFRWVSGDTQDQIVLYRTLEQKQAYLQARRAMRSARRRHVMREAAAGGEGQITVTTTARDERVRMAPPLRD